jgi:ferredoxin
VKQDRSLCIRCGECARACPVDAIHLSAQDNAPYLCIHCGRCVAFCPHSCLALNDTPERRAAVLPEFPAPPAARASEEVAK